MIDVHIHLADKNCISPGFWTSIQRSLSHSEEKFDRAAQVMVELMLRDSDAHGLVQKMNEAGISKGILLIADYGVALGEPKFSIEEIHEQHEEICAGSNGKLSYFLGYDPRRGKLADQLLKTYSKSEFCRGVKLYPPCGFELNSADLESFWRYCSDYQLVVLTHTGPSLSSLRTEREYPNSLIQVITSYPDLKVILAHAPIWDTDRSCQLLETYPDNLYADISSFQAILDDKSLKDILEQSMKVAPKQILYGSDYPLYNLSASLAGGIERIKRLLSAEDCDLIFEKNAQNLLF